MRRERNPVFAWPSNSFMLEQMKRKGFSTWEMYLPPVSGPLAMLAVMLLVSLLPASATPVHPAVRDLKANAVPPVPPTLPKGSPSKAPGDNQSSPPQFKSPSAAQSPPHVYPYEDMSPAHSRHPRNERSPSPQKTPSRSVTASPPSSSHLADNPKFRDTFSPFEGIHRPAPPQPPLANRTRPNHLPPLPSSHPNGRLDNSFPASHRIPPPPSSPPRDTLEKHRQYHEKEGKKCVENCNKLVQEMNTAHRKGLALQINHGFYGGGVNAVKRTPAAMHDTKTEGKKRDKLEGSGTTSPTEEMAGKVARTSPKVGAGGVPRPLAPGTSRGYKLLSSNSAPGANVASGVSDPEPHRAPPSRSNAAAQSEAFQLRPPSPMRGLSQGYGGANLISAPSGHGVSGSDGPQPHRAGPSRSNAALQPTASHPHPPTLTRGFSQGYHAHDRIADPSTHTATGTTDPQPHSSGPSATAPPTNRKPQPSPHSVGKQYDQSLSALQAHAEKTRNLEVQLRGATEAAGYHNFMHSMLAAAVKRKDAGGKAGISEAQLKGSLESVESWRKRDDEARARSEDARFFGEGKTGPLFGGNVRDGRGASDMSLKGVASGLPRLNTPFTGAGQGGREANFKSAREERAEAAAAAAAKKVTAKQPPPKFSGA